MDQLLEHQQSLSLPWSRALAAWREALGAAWVTTAGAALELANQATFATTQRAPALLEPGAVSEVIACVQIACHFGIPLYPISAGRNWGYGSQVPPRDGSALLSLARLNRILDYHEELAYVTVEPGVTFRRLSHFLQEQKSRLLPPMTGASPDASLIGNVLERGLGKGPYEDMAARSCAYEVVLTTGQIIRTGLADLPGAAAAPLTADGPGPSLQGIFNQSNLGIVTRMTFWLAPAPAWQQLICFPIRAATDLPLALDALRSLLQRSGSELQVELLNDYRFLAATRQYPYEECPGRTALPREWVAEHLPGMVKAHWLGGATLWADSLEELALRRRALRASLPAPIEHLHCAEPTPGAACALSADGLRSAYWRKRLPCPIDPHPDRDRCGVIWLAPVIPLLGNLAAQVVAQLEAIMLAHQFEPAISLRLTGGRAIRAIIGLFYDRDEAGEDARAAQCHDALRDTLYRQGLYPYRLGLRDLDAPVLAERGNSELLRALKSLMDPDEILAPGRYI